MFDTLTRMGASGAATSYSIDKSLRFNAFDDAYLGYTPSSTGNQKVWTWSGWVKRSEIGVYTNLITCDMHSGEHNNGIAQLAFDSSDKLYTYFDTSGSNPYGAVNDAVFRDVASWYHIVWQVDAANTDQKIWVNGVELACNSGQDPPDYSYAMNKASHLMAMGASAWDSVGGHSDLLLAEVHYIDGTKYQASDFGETNEDTGQWVPKKVSGITYGTNGCYLKFTDNSNTTAGTLGADSAGSNNWTPNNFSVSAGVGNDSFNDTPSNNWCTLSDVDSNSTIDVKQGGLQVYTSHGFDLIKSTFYLRSGKWYWEVTCDDCGNGFVGVSNWYDSYSNRGGDSNDSCTISTSNGDKRVNGSTSSYGSAVSDGDVMMFALDMDNGKFWAGKSGTWFNSGDPAAGSNPATSTLAGDEITPSISLYDDEDYTVNFGANMDFAHTPPTGFKAINMENYPAPTITNPKDYFNTILYTGNNADDRTITGVGFQPDLLWIKDRDTSSNAGRHYIFDKLRQSGGESVLGLALDAQGNDNDMSANGRFDGIRSDGFEVSGSDVDTNANSIKYVAYSWKESATAGFDMLTYTGDGNAGRTISHSLGVKPDVMLVKKRTGGNEDWILYCGDLLGTSGGWMKPNESDGTLTGHSSGFNGDDPTSSVFTVGDHSRTNENTSTYINYLWSSVAGFSKFGQYIGNEHVDGPYVWCGFKPQWLLIKNSARNAHWGLYDVRRNHFNTNSTVLEVNLNEQENSSGAAFDIYSNGFKVRNDSSSYNHSGESIFFMAFAERPFNYANAH